MKFRKWDELFGINLKTVIETLRHYHKHENNFAGSLSSNATIKDLYFKRTRFFCNGNYYTYDIYFISARPYSSNYTHYAAAI